MSEQIRNIWTRFDQLITDAKTPEAKATVEAIKLQTEMLNLKLTLIEQMIGAGMRQLGAK